jgi:hypothetical protein
MGVQGGDCLRPVEWVAEVGEDHAGLGQESAVAGERRVGAQLRLDVGGHHDRDRPAEMLVEHTHRQVVVHPRGHLVDRVEGGRGDQDRGRRGDRPRLVRQRHPVQHRAAGRRAYPGEERPCGRRRRRYDLNLPAGGDQLVEKFADAAQRRRRAGHQMQ